MAQQTLNNEGAFDLGLRTKINANFTDLYSRLLPANQTADVTATTNTTLANLTGLVQTLAVGTYKIKVSLQCLSTGNGGTKIAFHYTAPTSIKVAVKAFTASAVAVSRFTTTTDQATILGATVANIQIDIEGVIVVATAGTLQVQGAQNASHADTTTFYAGSTFEAWKIS